MEPELSGPPLIGAPAAGLAGLPTAVIAAAAAVAAALRLLCPVGLASQLWRLVVHESKLLRCGC